MGIDTNLNQHPYYDDFNEDKNYHRVLFKPAVAVQARELTQLQTILQNQIERFGDNILVEGTVVSGGNFTDIRNLPYVKVRDIAYDEADAETSTDVVQYENMMAVGLSTGVRAIIIKTEFGLETQAPNLNTLYVKYVKGALTGANTNQSTFASTEEIRLYSKDANGDYTVPYHRLTVAGDVAPNSIGNGYGVRCGDGIIYQKGNFIKFDNDLTIVSKYSNRPNGVVVGFQTIEELVTSDADASLLDNAAGFNNENAPGADRLKLTPKLVVLTLAEAEATEGFLAIQEYVDGNVVFRQTDTKYNQIGRELERRTAEESGNYVINPFSAKVVETANSMVNAYVVTPGLGYVEGKRVELINDIKLFTPKATTFDTVLQQDIITNYGSFVRVDNVSGRFNHSTLQAVNLRNSSNTVIGTANVRAFVRDGSTGVYRLYLFRIKMTGSASFRDVRTVKSATGTASVVLQSYNGAPNVAVLQDPSFNKAFFPLGKSFVRTVDASVTDFMYMASQQLQLSAGSNTLTLTAVSDKDTFPYADVSGTGSDLNSDELNEIIVVAHSAASPVSEGEIIPATSGVIPAGDNKTLVLTLAEAPSAEITVTAYFKLKRRIGSVNSKTLTTTYVKIDTSTNTGGTTGNYCLGMPDVYKVVGVWKASSGTSWATLEARAEANSNTGNFTQYFGLERKQFDDYYDLSSIKKVKPLTITSGDKIIVRVQVFKKDAIAGEFFTVNSYNASVDDTSVVLPVDKIRTEQLPSYTARDGVTYRLRDVIDVRPYATNTASYATAAADATVDPSSSVSFNSIIFPAPNETIETSFTYYLGRKDLIILNDRGSFDVIEGTPALEPASPAMPQKCMLIARLDVPPYPSLPARTASVVGKPEYGIKVDINQIRRYTMEDIGSLEQRIENIEYYTALSLLETKAKDFLVTDSEGLSRFKNGIFVDNFDNLQIADTSSPEFSVSIDPGESAIQPKIREIPLELKFKTGTGVTNINNDIALMNYTSYPLTAVSQTTATKTRTIAGEIFSFVGKVKINPEYDSATDTSRAPARDINLNRGMFQTMENLENLFEALPLQWTEYIGYSAYAASMLTYEPDVEVNRGNKQTKKVGDFITSAEFNPFMRAKNIRIRVSGLRPNTRHYFFFDGEDISQYVYRGVLTPNSEGKMIVTLANKKSNLPMISDEDGKLYAIFKLPEGKYNVGDRRLDILDVNDYDNRDSATSSGFATYTGYNYSVTKTALTSSTRPFTFSMEKELTSAYFIWNKDDN